MALPPFKYSPFGKPLEEIAASDLSVLRTVNEGWHVEYKEELRDASKAAKALASFANGYGGWIIYGVEDGGKGSAVPKSFPGVLASDVNRLMELLQAGASDCLVPSPYHDVRVLNGPLTDVGLCDGRCIVVVRVPPGANAPYVHQDGRIYRRVLDSSKPAFETDRHVLDTLLERSQSARTRWQQFVEDTFNLSADDQERTYLHVFMSADPHGELDTHLDIDIDAFVTLMKDASSETGGMPFDNIYPFEHGYVARQVGDSYALNLVPTWHQHRSGAASASFMLPSATITSDDTARHWVVGYEHGHALAGACQRAQHEGARLLDINFIPFVLAGAIQRYRKVLEAGNIKRDFVVKVRIDNTWRVVPFLDTSGFARSIQDHGLPVVQQASVWAPPGTSSWHDVSWALRENHNGSLLDGPNSSLVDAMIVAVDAARGLGVPLRRAEAGRLVDGWTALLQRAKRAEELRDHRRRSQD